MAEQTTQEAVSEIGRLFKEAVARYAYRRDVFVLVVTGEGMVTIQNDDKFRPHDFGQAPQQRFNKQVTVAAVSILHGLCGHGDMEAASN